MHVNQAHPARTHDFHAFFNCRRQICEQRYRAYTGRALGFGKLCNVNKRIAD